VNVTNPNFKHIEKTQEAIWLDDRRNPSWVKPEGTGTVQLNPLFTWNRKLTRYMIKTRWQYENLQWSFSNNVFMDCHDSGTCKMLGIAL
jgi:hypothetical protein